MTKPALVLALAALSFSLPAQSRPTSTIVCSLPPLLAAQSHYLVIPTALTGDGPEPLGFRAVAERMRAHHHAALANWDGRDADALQALLRQHAATEALFVAPPDVLDADLHRRVLRAVTRLDADPFVDVRFGWFVAESEKDLDALATRTIALHEKGLTSKRWLEASVISSGKSFTLEDSASPQQKAAGFVAPHCYWACVEKEPDVTKRVAKDLARFAQAGVIALSGNGDPRGVWLFSGQRNLQRERLVPFDPLHAADVKADAPRLLAEQVGALELQSPIVWSGTCHSAVAHKAWVENDIASTFGRVTDPTSLMLASGQSLGLAFVHAGACALLAPIGPNHGMSAMREQRFALAHGASLGEAVASSWNDVVLAHGEIPARGEREPVMASGGANRVLIGDPALRPFAKAADPGERLVITRDAAHQELRVELAWDPGFHAWQWDMYGKDRARDYRVVARVELDEGPPLDRVSELTVGFTASDPDGKLLPYELTRALVEIDRGHRYLHLAANAPCGQVDGKVVRAHFTIHWR